MDGLYDVVTEVLVWVARAAPAAGILVAVVYRKAHPTAARLVAVGLLCVLADRTLTGVAVRAATAVGGGPGDFGRLAWGQPQVVALPRELAELGFNLVGAAGWTMVLVALLATGAVRSTTAVQQLPGVR